ncbi:MAG: SOS response-associated peptidase, partial [Flavobacteriales bacterium]|nr:SOS response-associated peptidase [Flavobacteriales bacterium]
PRIQGGHYLSGFTHPEVPIFVYSQANGLELRPMKWGFIPSWCKDATLATKLWNQTLNVRSESMFEKTSFRAAAKDQRGIVLLQSFYEHHHFGKQSYPFNIRLRSEEAMYVAVIWDEWVDKLSGELRPTFSIVTVEGNELMAVLHNNPKLEGPRMPLILKEEAVEQWLMGDGAESKEQLLALCKPFAASEMKAHAVQKLSGKAALGDVKEATQVFEYPELMFDTDLMDALSD